jgi:hypothetical protein
MRETQQQPKAADENASEGASKDSIRNCDEIYELKELKLKMAALEENHRKEIGDWKVGKKNTTIFGQTFTIGILTKICLFQKASQGKSCTEPNRSYFTDYQD